MSSADTSHFSESTRAKDRPKPVDEELAAFAVLADPSAIATATPVKTPGASEDGAIIERLRAELSRRAKQVETLSRDLSTTHSAPVVDAAPTSESSWKPVGTASEAPAAEIAAKPAAKSDETGLKRLLHAAHRARHDIAEQLSAREDELEVLQRENKELVSTLESSRAELENQAAERARVQELEGSLTTRASAYERVSDECN
ncbi:MAG: hypothetical protein GY733_20895, partial [bacterium]|nr:hypothetical protein [bacterium]